MLLLFIPEFASQQLAGFVRNLSQPLFERLALLTVDVTVGRATGRACRLFVIGRRAIGLGRAAGNFLPARRAGRLFILTDALPILLLLPGAVSLGVAGLAFVFTAAFAGV